MRDDDTPGETRGETPCETPGRPGPQSLAETGLDSFAPYLMNRITRNYNEGMSAVMETAGLTVPKMRALSVLMARGALPLGDLAVLAISEQSTMSRIVDQMERDGLVSRTPSQSDHRVRVVDLTQDGRALHDRLWPIFAAGQDKLLGTLTEDERRQLLGLLRKILHAVRRNPV